MIYYASKLIESAAYWLRMQGKSKYNWIVLKVLSQQEIRIVLHSVLKLPKLTLSHQWEMLLWDKVDTVNH